MLAVHEGSRHVPKHLQDHVNRTCPALLTPYSIEISSTLQCFYFTYYLNSIYQKLAREADSGGS